MANPFENVEEAWEVSTGTMLPAGNHVCEVLSADASGESSSGYPQVALEVGNADGSIRDWLVITPKTLGKIIQVIQALGLEPPSDEQVDPSTHALAQGYVATWVGRRVGVVVRSEQDYKDPTKTRERVQGYVKPDAIKTSDITPPSGAGSHTGGAQPKATAPAHDDIPF